MGLLRLDVTEAALLSMRGVWSSEGSNSSLKLTPTALGIGTATLLLIRLLVTGGGGEMSNRFASAITIKRVM